MLQCSLCKLATGYAVPVIRDADYRDPERELRICPECFVVWIRDRQSVRDQRQREQAHADGLVADIIRERKDRVATEEKARKEPLV